MNEWVSVKYWLCWGLAAFFRFSSLGIVIELIFDICWQQFKTLGRHFFSFIVRKIIKIYWWFVIFIKNWLRYCYLHEYLSGLNYRHLLMLVVIALLFEIALQTFICNINLFSSFYWFNILCVVVNLFKFHY